MPLDHDLKKSLLLLVFGNYTIYPLSWQAAVTKTISKIFDRCCDLLQLTHNTEIYYTISSGGLTAHRFFLILIMKLVIYFFGGLTLAGVLLAVSPLLLCYFLYSRSLSFIESLVSDFTGIFGKKKPEPVERESMLKKLYGFKDLIGNASN